MSINPKDGAAMVLIPAGEFTMGSENYGPEEPSHQVYLDSYYIYTNLVTVAQYRRFCSETGRTMPEDPPEWGWKDDHPMVNITWKDAKAYCEWTGGSLPTEAQWEKAARGMDGRKFPWGNDFDRDRLWCSRASMGDVESTAPVGMFPLGASPYGALDMAGNVWEWCADWYSEDYYNRAPRRNPTGPGSGTYRVLRGGCWYGADERHFRCAIRGRYTPEDWGWRDDVGFRCVIPMESFMTIPGSVLP